MNEQDRQLLAKFLRLHRESLQPQQIGIVDNRRRRAKGLKREEVAELAGISLTWYTWIEQGREVNFSVEVLSGIADALQLQNHERHYIYKLCGVYAETLEAQEEKHISPILKRLIDSQDPYPAYAMGHYWQLLHWNQSAEALFGFSALAQEQRNILWYTFAYPPSRKLVHNWKERAQQLVSEFRADCSHHLNDPLLVDFLKKLQAESPEFSQWWAAHDVIPRYGGKRIFQHPRAGRLIFEQTSLRLSHTADIKIVIHLHSEENNEGLKILLS